MEAIIKNDELMHYGVLGMHWGIRRYQPYSTTGPRKGGKTGKEVGEAAKSGFSNKDKRKNYKEIKKAAKLSGRKSNYGASESFRNSVKETIKKSKILERSDIKKDLKGLNDAKDKWLNHPGAYLDFYYSDSYKKAASKAYNDTYNYFEKHDPEYLKEIIKNNNGKKERLTAFHDFRKTFEYYEEKAAEKAEKEWNKSKEGLLAKDADKLYNKYCSKQKEVGKRISEEMLGKYANKQINKKDTSYLPDTYADVVYSEILSMENSKKR